jgi:hypothetical protein
MFGNLGVTIGASTLSQEVLPGTAANKLPARPDGADCHIRRAAW